MTESTHTFVICMVNKDCEDLEKRKVYRTLPDTESKQRSYIRVVDESGEDHHCPVSYFIPA